jgi:hypothetical protein
MIRGRLGKIYIKVGEKNLNNQSNLKINKGKKQSQKENKCDNETKVAMLMRMMQVMKYLLFILASL